MACPDGEGQAEWPQRIAHRAGNSRAALRQALAEGVDWIEVDLWWHYGRLVARHERALWRLPVTYDTWRVHVVPPRPIELRELLLVLNGGPRLFIDFKGLSRRLPGAVVQALQEAGAVSRAAICGQNWRQLDLAARLEPSLRVAYSFGSLQHVEAMRRRPAGAPTITHASVAQTLLTPDLMQEFQARGIRVFAWTVNSPLRARELIELGVAGIISDRLDLLVSLRHPGPPAAPSTVRAR